MSESSWPSDEERSINAEEVAELTAGVSNATTSQVLTGNLATIESTNNQFEDKAERRDANTNIDEDNRRDSNTNVLNTVHGNINTDATVDEEEVETAIQMQTILYKQKKGEIAMQSKMKRK